jgi:DNA-binding beta-propeller fold protein YncE
MLAVRLLPITVASIGSIVLGGCAPTVRSAPSPVPVPAAPYAVYVVSEAADLVARVGYGVDGGARLEHERPVSTRPHENDGPHGVAVAPDGRYYYVTIGHGVPFGALWKLDGRTHEIVGRVTLGLFPATVDVTPDGEYGFVSNFNLHGDHVPSSISKVHLPTMTEISRIETCVMPHGSRVSADGRRHYSVCMMDDLLVVIDVAGGRVTRWFSVSPGAEGTVQRPRGTGHDHADAPRDPRVRAEPDAEAAHAHDAQGGAGAVPQAQVCSPTWAQPSPGGERVYVTCNLRSEVLEVDVRSWSVSRRFSTGEAPYNIDVTPDGRLLLVTLKNRTAPAVEVIELESGRSLARIATSTTLPHGIAIPGDGRYAFVSVEGVGSEPGKVDVIDLTSLERIDSIEVGQLAAGIAAVP